MFKPPLNLICPLTGWRIPRYIRINYSGIFLQGYANIFLWNSIVSLICEVAIGDAPPQTVICVIKNTKPPLWEGVLNLAKFTLKVILVIFFSDSKWRIQDGGRFEFPFQQQKQRAVHNKVKNYFLLFQGVKH